MKTYITINDLLQDLHVMSPSSHSDFHIFKFEETNDIEKDALNPHKKDFFTIDLYLENKSERQIGHTEIKDLNDSIAFNSPMQLFSVQQFENRPGSEGFSIVFTPQFIEKHQYQVQQEFPFFKLNSYPILKLTREQKKTVAQLFATLHQEQQTNDVHSENLLRAYLMVLLETCKRQVGQTSGFLKIKRYQELTANFEELILSNSEQIKTIAEYAERLNVTPIYLSECVKKTSGLSAKKVLSNYQVLRAKSLLTQTSYSIEEVANEMGFDEATNFIKFFKKLEGITPAAFRKLP